MSEPEHPNPQNKPRRAALGKGLGSLLGGMDQSRNVDAVPQDSHHGQALLISPNQIRPNPQQPRTTFNPEQLAALAASVKVNGIIQPLVVAPPDAQGIYTLVAGERRLRAAMAAELSSVPVVVRETSPEELLRWALIENIQRADLNVIEEAQAYDDLINKYGLTQEACAARVGKDRSAITNALRMLHMPSQVQDDLIQGRLSFGHGKVLGGLESTKQILSVRELVVKKSLSVRQTEKVVKQLKKPEKPQGDPSANRDLDYLANTLREHLRTKVKFVGSGSRGKIEISYFSASELERLLGLIGPDIS